MRGGKRPDPSPFSVSATHPQPRHDILESRVRRIVRDRGPERGLSRSAPRANFVVVNDTSALRFIRRVGDHPKDAAFAEVLRCGHQVIVLTDDLSVFVTPIEAELIEPGNTAFK